MFQLITALTRVTPNSASCIDHIHVSDPSCERESGVSSNGVSDHDTIHDPDTKYLAFKTMLKFVFNTHTSNKEKLVKSKSSAWLSPDLENLIHKRN